MSWIMVFFKTGINLQYQENEPNPETGVRRFIPDYQKTQFGLLCYFKQKLERLFYLKFRATY